MSATGLPLAPAARGARSTELRVRRRTEMRDEFWGKADRVSVEWWRSAVAAVGGGRGPRTLASTRPTVTGQVKIITGTSGRAHYTSG